MATIKIPERPIRNFAARCAFALTLLTVANLNVAANAQTAPAQTPNILEQVGDALTALVYKAQPCVVTIQARPHTMVIPQIAPLLSPQQRAALSPEKQKEYDESQERSRREINDFFRAAQALGKPSFTGSGFILRGGFVITTAEVAERIEEPTVVFSDGRRMEIQWANADGPSNIAVMKIEAPSDAGLDWADSAFVEPGGIAIAIGSQGEFPRSVSLGIISGLGRAGRSGRRRYENLIQFQGAVGAGGSGGPLLNARGELIGMVVAAPADVFASGSRLHLENRGQKGARPEEHPAAMPPPMTPFSGLSNMGFALASNDIRPITAVLCRHEKRPSSGYIGIYLSPDLESPTPEIVRVLPNSPAAKAGLLVGDIITAINGQSFRMAAELRAFAGRIAAGEALQITFQRGAETKTARLTALPREKQ